MLVVGGGLEEEAAERFNGNHAAAAKLLHVPGRLGVVVSCDEFDRSGFARVPNAVALEHRLPRGVGQRHASILRLAAEVQKTPVAPTRNHTTSARSRVNDAQRRAKRSSSLAALGRRKRTIQMSPANVVIDRTVSKVLRPSGLSFRHRVRRSGPHGTGEDLLRLSPNCPRRCKGVPHHAAILRSHLGLQLRVVAPEHLEPAAIVDEDHSRSPSHRPTRHAFDLHALVELDVLRSASRSRAGCRPTNTA